MKKSITTNHKVSNQGKKPGTKEIRGKKGESKFKKLLLNLIPEGKDNAINSKDLAAYLGVDNRSICAGIRALRIDGHLIACSKEGSGGGYFKPITQGEAQEYLKTLRNEKNTIAETYKIQKKSANERFR